MSKGNVLSLYTDELPIGMDHPLFMAKEQTQIDAALSTGNGIPFVEALRVIPHRIETLFGEVPAALITAEITLAYSAAATSAGGSSRGSLDG